MEPTENKKDLIGSVFAEWELAVAQLNGDPRMGIKQNSKLGFEKLLKRAKEHQEPDATYLVGMSYFNGIGVKKCLKSAWEWNDLACKQGHAAALGNITQWSRNREILHKLSESGDVKAQNLYGESFYGGHGGRQCYESAVKWFKLAADQGCSESQYKLGHLYYKGNGVKQCYKNAVQWFKLSTTTQDNHIQAQYALGTCFENGYGVEKSLSEAIRWYELCTETYSKMRAKQHKVPMNLMIPPAIKLLIQHADRTKCFLKSIIQNCAHCRKFAQCGVTKSFKSKGKKVKLSECSRCMSVRYCSEKCQKKHWKKKHKFECKAFATRRNEPFCF